MLPKLLRSCFEALKLLLSAVGASYVSLLQRTKHWFSMFVGSLAALGGLLEASRSVLETSWSCLGAAAATDATFDASEAASKLLRSALGSIFSCFEALLERLAQFFPS